MGKVVILSPVPAEFVGTEIGEGHDVVAVGRGEDPAAACVGADVVIADYTAHHRVAGDVVAVLAPTCRLVQVPSAGLDGVDVTACARAGIPVASAAGMNAVAVAEWCVWAAIGSLRRLVPADRSLRAGRWEQDAGTRFELAGKVVGIVGMGAVGQAVAQRLRCFDVELRYWTRNRRPADVEEGLGLRYAALDDLVAAADVLLLVVALGEETTKLLHVGRIATMKPTAVVVNAARGGVADEAALAAALRDGRLHGAAVDVFSREPPPPDHPLLACDTAAVTPHLAGTTAESVERILAGTFRNVTRALAGEPPDGRVA